jgi:hypothetical protein
MRGLLILSCVSLCSFAQPGVVRMPALGYAPDARSNQIRPIRGVPGASILSEAVDTSVAFTAAAIAQDFALAVSSDDRQVYVIPFSGEAARAVPGARMAPSKIVLSPSGRAAILWGDAVQVMTGFSGAPQVADLPLGSLPATPTAIAVSDDGQVFLSADSGGAWAAGPNLGAVSIAAPGTIAAMAFRRDSHDAIAITRSGDVYSIGNAGADADIRQVRAGDEQTSDPVAVQISPDGSRAFAANSRGVAAAIDLQTGSTAAVNCGCAPTGMEPMRDPFLYRLTGVSDLPVMLFDAGGPAPRVWFVPADAAGQRSAQ